jgi:hypothetical protein
VNFIVVWRGDPIKDMSSSAQERYPIEVWNNYLEIEILVARGDTHQVVFKETSVAPTCKGLTQEEIELKVSERLHEFEKALRLIEPRPIMGLLEKGKD